MYAAIRLPASQARELAKGILQALGSEEHKTLDIVLDDGGHVTVEDDGVEELVVGELIDYGNGEHNVFESILGLRDDTRLPAEEVPAVWDKIDGGAEGTSLEQRADLMDDDERERWIASGMPCTD